jgi:hypothetical protein
VDVGVGDVLDWGWACVSLVRVSLGLLFLPVGFVLLSLLWWYGLVSVDWGYWSIVFHRFVWVTFSLLGADWSKVFDWFVWVTFSFLGAHRSINLLGGGGSIASSFLGADRSKVFDRFVWVAFSFLGADRSKVFDGFVWVAFSFLRAHRSINLLGGGWSVASSLLWADWSKVFDWFVWVTFSFLGADWSKVFDGFVWVAFSFLGADWSIVFSLLGADWSIVFHRFVWVAFSLLGADRSIAFSLLGADWSIVCYWFIWVAFSFLWADWSIDFDGFVWVAFSLLGADRSIAFSLLWADWSKVFNWFVWVAFSLFGADWSKVLDGFVWVAFSLLGANRSVVSVVLLWGLWLISSLDLNLFRGGIGWFFTIFGCVRVFFIFVVWVWVSCVISSSLSNSLIWLGEVAIDDFFNWRIFRGSFGSSFRSQRVRVWGDFLLNLSWDVFGGSFRGSNGGIFWGGWRIINHNLNWALKALLRVARFISDFLDLLGVQEKSFDGGGFLSFGLGDFSLEGWFLFVGNNSANNEGSGEGYVSLHLLFWKLIIIIY